MSTVRPGSWISLAAALAFLLMMPMAAAKSKGKALSLPAVQEPELPRVLIDTTFPSTEEYSSVEVPAGGNLQAAINAASCDPHGTVLRLAAGATFTGRLTLPAKNCASGQWIIIRTDTADSNLPAAGARINPSYATTLAKILTPNAEPAVKAASRAEHYWFMGVEIGVANNAPLNYGVFWAGSGETLLSEVPHHIVVDRCYIHGNSTGNIKSGLVANGAYVAAINSYFENFHAVGQDTQAILSFSGPGPIKIVNNFLEAAGENVLFGGAAPALQDVVPSDIEIRRNHFFKPLSWKVGNPSFAGTPWGIKNLLEFKDAQRVLVEGNVIENNWLHSQGGCAVLMTPRGERRHCPWCTVADITFRYNILRHAGGGFALSGEDDESGPSEPSQRISIHDNLILDINGATWGSPKGGNADGRLFTIANGGNRNRLRTPHDITINHNTAFQTGAMIFTGDATSNPIKNVIYINNIQPHGPYGISGSGMRPGTRAISTYFADSAFTRNVIERLPPDLMEAEYPPGNFFPSDWAAVKFVNLEKGDLHLKPSSPYHNAGTDGKDIGADVDAVLQATAGAAP